MKLEDLPPAHLGPFGLEGLEWMVLPDGYVMDAVCGVTHSLDVAKKAHVRLDEVGFTYTGPKTHGMMERMFEFGYCWIDRSDRGIVYGRRVWVVLVAIAPEEVPFYEVVTQQPPHVRQGAIFSAQEVPEKRRLFPHRDFWTRPTLD